MSDSNSVLMREIAEMPKSERHLHLEGALPWGMLRPLLADAAAVAGEPPPPAVPASWRANFRYPSFAAFDVELIANATAWFTSVERYAQAAAAVFEQLQQSQNVRVVETSFAGALIAHLGLDGQEVARAIKQAAPPGLDVRVFIGMHRQAAVPGMLQLAQTIPHWDDALAGIDLHGPETPPLEPWAEKLWHTVRASGRKVKAHAGEFGSAQSVRDAVEKLGVRYVQHGVRAVEDPAVVELLLKYDVTLDVCPTSNVKLQVVPSMAEHPIRALVDAGVRCTVNTDDPLSFGTTLNEEYLALGEQAGFGLAELRALAKASLRGLRG